MSLGYVIEIILLKLYIKIFLTMLSVLCLNFINTMIEIIVMFM